MGVPPKTLKKEFEKMRQSGYSHGEGYDGGNSARNAEVREIAHRAGMDLKAQAESLPVLEAFQEFLDNERRRARKNLVTIGLSFLFILLLLAGIGGGFAYMFAQRIRADVGNLENGFSRFQDSWRDQRSEMHSSIAGLTGDTSRIEKNLTRERQELAAVREKLEQQEQGVEARMVKLARAMLGIKQENRRLQNELSGMRKHLAEASNRLQSIAADLPPIDTAGTSAASSQLLTDTGVVEVPVTGSSGRKWGWRIPIPE
jgi:hypothetical protein